MTVKKDCRMLFVSFGLVILLVGCSSRKVTTSAEDQSLFPGQEAGSPASSKEVRATESSVPPSAQPLDASRSALIPSPEVPSSHSGVSPVQPAPFLKGGSLSDIFFDYDRFTLRSDARTTLEANARVLMAWNGTKLLIEGNCDERGTLAYNLVLGERRAQSVKRYLQELGIPESRLHITSYGKERPFCQEHREACWQQNRRAHFVAQ